MEILLTGFTAFLTQEWIETAFPNDHVLTTCAKGEALSDTQIKTVTLESRQLLDQLAETYQFDRVVYFSEYLLPHGDQEGELDRLRRVLQSCREREVELLYLSGPEAAFAPSTGKTLLANAAEELCFHYARTSKLQVKVFRLPYLYAVSASGADQFARLFEQMPAGTVQMDEQAAQPLLALCAEELADLVARVFDTWTPEPERFTLPDVFGNTQGQLGEVLQKLQPGLKVLYGTDTIQTYPAADNAVRRRYGWFQRYSILDDLPAIYNAWCARKTEKKSFIRKMVDKIRRSSLLLRLVEIAAAWLATELLVRITGTDAQFRMVDFRLMFVVLIGTVDQWLDVIRAIEQEGLWVNRGFLPGRPMYAAGVRQNGSLVVLIGLYTASEEQMTLYYQNLFRILCGLVETALVRAFEYESVVRENWYLPDTCLLRPAVFAEQLATACTLQEDKMAHHLLLQVTGTFKNRAEFNDRVRRSIRSTDAAGVGTNNAVYLLMNQTDEENLPLLTRRLDERGLHVTAVPLDEQLRLISAAKQEASHA